MYKFHRIGERNQKTWLLLDKYLPAVETEKNLLVIVHPRFSNNLDYYPEFDRCQTNDRQTSIKLYKLKLIGHEKIISSGALIQKSNGKHVEIDGMLQN